MKFIFWFSFSIIFYVYFLYPGIIYLIALIHNKKFFKKSIFPSISIIITAYNEENDIAAKVENTLSLEYPNDKIEIVIGSDGSTDNTNKIVRKYESLGIQLFDFKENRGKTATQNDCVSKAKNDIIIFMDAASICHENALKEIVSNFADPRVGAVAGRINFITSKDNIVTQSQGLYWQYEQFLKQNESKIGSLVGVDGPLYAIRKKLYIPLESDMISDLLTPLLVLKQGASVILDSKAITYEEATKKTTDENKTRRRIVLRGLIGLTRFSELLNPLHHPMLSWQIFSHKIIRWLVGVFYILMMLSSLLLSEHIFYLSVFLCTIMVLGLAYYGHKNPDNKKTIFIVPYYFSLVNYAALLGVIDFVRGKNIISWKPVRK